MVESIAILQECITFAGDSRIRDFLYLNGEMAEWSIAAVLKTVELRGSGGSNPSLSAGRFQKVFTRVFNLAFKKQIIVVKSRFYNDFSLYIAHRLVPQIYL